MESGGKKSRSAYPEPSIVVGVGRFGLQVLERLGEDWEWLKASSADESIGNLRLLHIASGESVNEQEWRALEAPTVKIAATIGEGDLPSLVLDFCILRCLGLIRYRNGYYEVGLPVDAGVIQNYAHHRSESDENGPSAVVESLYRRRYFRWLKLAEDPILSAEVLHGRTRNLTEFDNFISPLIRRVREGHSPNVILNLIARQQYHEDGLDPSPWHWMQKAMLNADIEEAPFDGKQVNFSSSWLQAADVEAWSEMKTEEAVDGATNAQPPLEGYAEAPIDWWRDFRQKTPSSTPCALNIPRAFIPPEKFNPSPIPEDAEGYLFGQSKLVYQGHPLLRVDWDQQGWAQDDEGSFQYAIVPISPFRLGLFDHHIHYGLDGFGITDSSSRIEHLEERIRQMAVELKKGLLRLWLDIQWSLAPDPEDDGLGGTEATTRQTLEFLGHLIVKPTLEDEEGVDVPELSSKHFESHEDKYFEGPQLADQPSEFLRERVIARISPDDGAERALERRLSALGLGSFEASDEFDHRLYHRVYLRPNDLPDEGLAATIEPVAPDNTSVGLAALRRRLNREVRHIFGMTNLTHYRKKAVRKAPRLTVYLVADMSEPFSRTSIRQITREIHAELQRAFGPIFDTFHTGFDRSLNILPILSTPHPADALKAGNPLESRLEEAVVIESVHRLRRWLEVIPKSVSCVSQIFVNARVTEHAVVSIRDAVRQTVDFVSLLTRNDLAADRWLREISIGRGGSDFLSSFSCYQIQFPAQRAREYAATRLAIDTVERLKRREDAAQTDGQSNAFGDDELPQRDLLDRTRLERVQQRLHKKLDARAGKFQQTIHKEANDLAIEVDGHEVMKSYGDEKAVSLQREVIALWQNLSQRQGDMFGYVDEVLRGLSQNIGRKQAQIRRASDEAITEHASDGGLQKSQSLILARKSHALRDLKESESDRQSHLKACEKHDKPSVDGIPKKVESIKDAAEKKAAYFPMMRVGLLIWALLSVAFGLPIIYFIYEQVGFANYDNWLQWILGALAYPLAAAIFTIPAWWLFKRSLTKQVQAIKEEITSLGDSLRDVVMDQSGRSEDGTQIIKASDASSIWSFFASRLQFSGTLSQRAYSGLVFEQCETDYQLARRISRSLDAQQALLNRHFEDLGVRQSLAERDGADADDVTELFMRRSRIPSDSFLEPTAIRAHYKQSVARAEWKGRVANFVRETGGLSDWRQRACFSDTAAILEYGRLRFNHLVDQPLTQIEDQVLTDEAITNLRQFVERYFANLGFGAKFVGYEGLDPDGIQMVAQATLLVPGGFDRAVEKILAQSDNVQDLSRTLDRKQHPILPNTAFMLSLAQDITARSFQNLTRFESALERAEMSAGQMFPWTSEGRLIKTSAEQPVSIFADVDNEDQSEISADTNIETETHMVEDAPQASVADAPIVEATEEDS